MLSKKQLVNKYIGYHEKLKNVNKINLKKNRNTMRIMTYNIHMWYDCFDKTNVKNICDIIFSSKADIIGLQEIMFNKRTIQIKKFIEIAKENGYEYYRFCDVDGTNCLLSKYPVIESKVYSLEKDSVENQNRYAIIGKIKINKKILNIIVTHLDVFDETGETRKKQAHQIIDKLNINENYILLGDFNSLKQDDYEEKQWINIVKDDNKRGVDTICDTIPIFEKNNFVDCFSKKSCEHYNNTVWSNRRVDYIMVKQNNIKIDKCFVLHATESDHCPVVMDI